MPSTAIRTDATLPTAWSIPTLSLAGIFAILFVQTLQSARVVFLPIALAILGNFALTPVTRSLARRGLPTPLAAALVVIVLVVVGSSGVVALSTPAATWLERAPTTMREIERKLRPIREPVEKLARATRDVQDATALEEKPGDQVLMGDRSLFADLVLRTQGFLTTLIATLVLLYFMLATENGITRALSAVPHRVSDVGRVRRILETIEEEVSQHLLMISLINLGLGIVVGLALKLLEVPNPALWGAMAALLNFVPFIGAIAGTVIVTGVAPISFDEPGRALVVMAVYAGLTGIEGLLISPVVLGKRLTLSPVAVFVSILLWSWIWGVPGALIAVPVLAVMKIVADRVDSLRGLGAMIGNRR